MSHIVLNGDNIDVLKKYPDNYFDAVVTDPPYGLGKEPDAAELMKSWVESGYHEVKGSGFMGKEWDAFVPQPIFWKEVFRVLKHGGHVLAFYGTRTYDWGVMAMRFAGFEVRDTIYWHYGSGFPKSHNISKAVDKMGGESLDWFIDYILDIAKDRNISKKELTMLFPSKNGNATGWLWNKQNNQSITTEQFNIIKNFLKLPFSDISEAKGEILGRGKAGLTKGNIAKFSGDIEFDIIAPESENAKKWQGWGSALKPASEPIVMARKPLEKGLSIAENVLKYGTGGINIDGCRIGFKDEADYKESTQKNQHGDFGTQPMTNNTTYGDWSMVQPKNYQPTGRFPANLILGCSCKTDEHESDCPIRIMDEQSGISKSTDAIRKNNRPISNAFGKYNPDETKGHSDSGGASRFFYCAKASKSERNKGLDDFEDKKRGDINKMMGESGNFKTGGGNDRNTHFKNFHPTVKPVKLMQYLVRLVTPPNGVVLDPFCGSGTTGIACKLEGFQFVGIEQDPEYTKIAEARINNFTEEKEVVIEKSKEIKENKSTDNKDIQQGSLF